MFFEDYHSKEENEFSYYSDKTLAFPTHTHRSFEYYGQLEGTSVAIVDGTEYKLKKGDAILIFPFQKHSYCGDDESRHEFLIFSPDMVSDFFKTYENLVPENNLFRFSLPREMDSSNVFLARSLVYAICGNFEKQNNGYKKTPRVSGDILVNMLVYAEEHYCSQCLIGDVAAELGYDYSYISKQFKQKVGISFNKYVNLLRVRKACYLIKNSNLTISEAMLQCGFTSVRSFNRNFVFFLGQTPSQYRKNYKVSVDKEFVAKWNKYTAPFLAMGDGTDKIQ